MRTFVSVDLCDRMKSKYFRLTFYSSLLNAISLHFIRCQVTPKYKEFMKFQVRLKPFDG